MVQQKQRRKQRDGQVKAKVFNKVNSYEVQKYINKNVEKGSILSTDEVNFYRPIRNYKKVNDLKDNFYIFLIL